MERSIPSALGPLYILSLVLLLCIFSSLAIMGATGEKRISHVFVWGLDLSDICKFRPEAFNVGNIILNI